MFWSNELVICSRSSRVLEERTRDFEISLQNFHLHQVRRPRRCYHYHIWLWKLHFRVECQKIANDVTGNDIYGESRLSNFKTMVTREWFTSLFTSRPLHGPPHPRFIWLHGLHRKRFIWFLKIFHKCWSQNANCRLACQSPYPDGLLTVRSSFRALLLLFRAV